MKVEEAIVIRQEEISTDIYSMWIKSQHEAGIVPDAAVRVRLQRRSQKYQVLPEQSEFLGFRLAQVILKQIYGGSACWNRLFT